MNKAKNRLIYASTVLNEMEVYDMNLTPIKLVRGPDKLKAAYVVKQNSISFNGFAPYSYRKYCTDENGYYVSYIGDYYQSQIHCPILSHIYSNLIGMVILLNHIVCRYI